MRDIIGVSHGCASAGSRKAVEFKAQDSDRSLQRGPPYLLSRTCRPGWCRSVCATSRISKKPPNLEVHFSAANSDPLPVHLSASDLLAKAPPLCSESPSSTMPFSSAHSVLPLEPHFSPLILVQQRVASKLK